MFYIFDTDVIIFSFKKNNHVYIYDLNKRTALIYTYVNVKSNLKGKFALSNGKGFRDVLERKSIKITSHNLDEHGNSRSLTIVNSNTGVESDIYFDRFSEHNIVFPALNACIRDCEIAFEIDDKFKERFKFQSKTEELVKDFCITNENGEIEFKFGCLGSTLGSFCVEEANKNVAMHKSWYFTKKEILKILKLDGHLTMYISSKGFIKIRCTTPFAEYFYIIPAQSR